MPPSTALGVRLDQRRLAEEEVGVAGELRELVARPAVARVRHRLPVARDAEAVGPEVVVEDPARRDRESPRLEVFALAVLLDREGLVEHVRGSQPLTDLAQQLDAARRHPQVRPGLLGGRAEPQRPDPRDDVAPVVEVEVGEADRVDARPVLQLAELREHPGAAVEEHAPGRPLDEVTRLRASGIGPRRRAADHLELHFHSLAYTRTAARPYVFHRNTLPILTSGWPGRSES